MEMRHISAKAGGSFAKLDVGPSYRNMATSLAVASPVLVLCILLGATGIFFLLPRVSAGYLGAYAPGGEITSGFSDTVELGRIGEIQQSGSVVMHIQIDGDDRGSFDLKWRGVALSNFDGRTWSNHHEQYLLPERLDGRFVFPPRAASSAGTLPSDSLSRPDGTGGNERFFPRQPRQKALRATTQHLTEDDGGAVFDLDPERPVNRYQATSNIAQPGLRRLAARPGRYPPDVLSSYLALPPVDPRIPQLAQQITASADNNYDKARGSRDLSAHSLRVQPAAVAHRAARSSGQFPFRAQARTLRILRVVDGGHAADAGDSFASGQRISHRRV